jgi:hypothetical protein
MTRSIRAVLLLTCGLAGCVTELAGPDQGLPGVLAPLVAGGDTQQAAPGAAPDADDNTDIPIRQSIIVQGSVTGKGTYQMFDLGPGALGEQWEVLPNGRNQARGPFTLVLLDDQFNLLMRTVVSGQSRLSHVARHATPHVYLGVTPSSTSAGGAFDLEVRWQGGQPVPAAVPQLVYLNFEGASAVRVHGREPLVLPPFDAGSVAAHYAGASAEMAHEIAQTIRLDYARYNVLIFSSVDGPPPEDSEYSTIYFGGSDEALLGLADNVDMYNRAKDQAAIVYVESFSPYSLMGLDTEEMALMIGNVASHELGHLLGLYHTDDPEELMDSTGSAWDLTRDQAFGRAPLEGAVFPTGMQNAPLLLEQTVGLNPKAQPSAKLLSAAKIAQRARMREFTRSEISRRCGLCLNPDDIGAE